MLGDSDRINRLSKYQDINQVDSDGNNAVMRICKGDYTDNNNPVTVVETLIDLGLRLDATNYNGDTPLTLLGSVRSYCPDMNKRSEDIGRLLLKRGVHPEVVNNEGQTSLMKASLSGLDNLVVDLLNRTSSDIDHTTPRDGRSILQHLCHVNNGKTATLLLDHGACINHQDYQGRTALAIAIEKGHEPLAYILMTPKYCADPDLPDHDGLTSLHWAIIKNQPRIVDVLLQSGADRLLRIKNGLTPLMVAVAEGNMKIVDCLINVANQKERQRIVNQIDYDGVTPLIKAVKMKHIGIVKLLAGDTFLSHCDYVHGMNALMWAIHGCKHMYGDVNDAEIINTLHNAYLTSSGGTSAINQTSQCALGQTALHFAVGKMNWIMEMFLRYKDHINLDVPDNQGCTPLMRALLYSDSDRTRHQSMMLINAGAKLDVLSHHLDGPGYGSLSPLHYAVLTSPFFTRYLLDNGASVDFQNADGDTALMHAIRHGFAGQETIEILMGWNPDVSITNNKGETAFSIASDLLPRNKGETAFQIDLLPRVLDPLVWNAITPRQYKK